MYRKCSSVFQQALGKTRYSAHHRVDVGAKTGLFSWGFSRQTGEILLLTECFAMVLRSRSGFNCSHFDYPHGRILVFAKEPVLGKVKTRLHGSLNEEQALELHKTLLRHVYTCAQGAKLSPIELWVSSNPSHELFLSLCNKTEIHLQSGLDLGLRMKHAAQQTLVNSRYVVIIGSDCPAITPAYLGKALRLLENGSKVVLGPAEDGGYVLLGLRCVPQSIFVDMPWGSDKVLSITRMRLEQQGLDWEELAELWDVDRPEDLLRLASLSPKLRVDSIFD